MNPAVPTPPESEQRERTYRHGTALVLFDLDGTLADTAPDLVNAINACLEARGQAPRPLAELRPWVSHGARGLIERTFGIGPGAEEYELLREEFVRRYEADLCRLTTLFPGVEDMLARIEAASIQWGIVTNKIARLTDPLVQKLRLDGRAACIVSGDTAARAKPDPAPITLALEQCGCAPHSGAYVGDDRRDIQAGRAAGVRTFAAAYGYSVGIDDISQWQADHIIQSPVDLLRWVLPGAGA
jgi:phosphoglycolate phosphatase